MIPVKSGPWPRSAWTASSPTGQRSREMCYRDDEMSERRNPGSFAEDTAATPLVHLVTERSVGPRRPCLLVVAGARLGEIFPIEREILIGRDADAQIRLPDDEGVSRRHARVMPAGGEGALIADLGSANGVWVDG